MPLLAGQHDPHFCRGGIASMEFYYENGCIQTWPKHVSPYVMSQVGHP